MEIVNFADENYPKFQTQNEPFYFVCLFFFELPLITFRNRSFYVNLHKDTFLVRFNNRNFEVYI